jgi:hypothetical protein
VCSVLRYGEHESVASIVVDDVGITLCLLTGDGVDMYYERNL